MRFNRKVNWKCVQVKDWTKVCVHNMENDLTERWKSVYLTITKSVYLTIVTWDLTERWTENVSKIDWTKSVYLTMVTSDLTKRWAENVSKYMIELKLCT